MFWALLFVGIALAGLVVVVCLAVWLWRRTMALLGEVGTAADRAGELMDLLASVGTYGPELDDKRMHSNRTSRNDLRGDVAT